MHCTVGHEPADIYLQDTCIWCEIVRLHNKETNSIEQAARNHRAMEYLKRKKRGKLCSFIARHWDFVDSFALIALLTAIVLVVLEIVK